MLNLAGEPIAHRTSRNQTRRAVSWLVAAVMIGASGCAFLEKTSKKINDLEETQMQEGLKRKPGGAGQPSQLSSLRATPSALDFGQVPVASERHEAVVISNPSRFAVTVVHVTVQGCGFAVSSKSGDRPVIPQQGQLTLTLTFQPAAPGACQGLLLIEIDSAGGRFTRVVLTGRGV